MSKSKPADKTASLVAILPPKKAATKNQLLDLRSAPSRALRKCSTAFDGRENSALGEAFQPSPSVHSARGNIPVCTGRSPSAAGRCRVKTGSPHALLSLRVAGQSIHLYCKRSSRHNLRFSNQIANFITRPKVVVEWHHPAILLGSRRC
jgi:hypothetical protein